MSKEVRIPFTRKYIGRFLFLLICLVSLFVLRPFLEGSIGVRLLMDIFITFLLISGACAISQKRTTFIVGLILAIPALLIQWASHMLPFSFLEVLAGLFSALFLAYVAVVILNYLFREKKVAPDVIYGAICVYLLIGLVWATGYSFLEIYDPGAFELGKIPVADPSRFVYYSYVTMTTLGYGDITPLSSPAQFLSVLEAITGQLYLAVIIARLMGLHISHSLSVPD